MKSVGNYWKTRLYHFSENCGSVFVVSNCGWLLVFFVRFIEFQTVLGRGTDLAASCIGVGRSRADISLAQLFQTEKPSGLFGVKERRHRTYCLRGGGHGACTRRTHKESAGGRFLMGTSGARTVSVPGS